MHHAKLQRYGLNTRIEQEASLHEELVLARISEQHRDIYRVITEEEELHATISGKLRYQAISSTDLPGVGDWAMVERVQERAIIHQILHRRSVIRRKAAGTSQAMQVLAANVDAVFVCMSLDNDFNLRRLERYLSLVYSSMATPVIVLTKADLVDSVDARLAEISAMSPGTDVVACSGLAESGYQSILPHITEGKTVVFLGSSGVGKSTLINRLLGSELLATKEVRKDGKGRHATTHRQLLLLPNGGIVIDTPGMRELQLGYADLSRSFEDIESLSLECKFNDCSHTSEPECGVQEAIRSGDLTPERLQNYKKLHKELGYANLDGRQREQQKIRSMFGSKNELKQITRHLKRNKR